jgi:hypothetical protein
MIYDGAFLNPNAKCLPLGLLAKFSLAFGAMCFKYEQHYLVSIFRNRIPEFEKYTIYHHSSRYPLLPDDLNNSEKGIKKLLHIAHYGTSINLKLFMGRSLH